jgi:5,10-methylenetetrahydromethanopterin reductase
MIRIPADLLVLGRHPAGELERLADEARSAGYRRLWMADERFFRDCWVVLGALASNSGDLGLGVCVTDPFVRHPALTATAAATVDELSDGSFTLGLGAGISGFEAMGIDRRRPLVAMREAIQSYGNSWQGTGSSSPVRSSRSAVAWTSLPAPRYR